MKRIALLLLASLMIISVSCKKNKPTTGDINITCKALDGQTVDVSSLTVELHKRPQFDLLFKSATAAGSSTISIASFKELVPDTYYVLAWKDLDGDNLYSKDDYFGFYPYPILVAAGDKKDIKIELYVIE